MKVLLTSIFMLFVLCAVSQSAGRTVISAQGMDVSYRISRAAIHAEDKNTETYRDLISGEDLLNVLTGEPIKLWIHFSHGRTDRLFGKNPDCNTSWFSSGLLLTDNHKTTFKSARSLTDLQNLIFSGKISFTEDAIIYLGACRVAETDLKTNLIFAQELANITGAKVIGGGHQTEPLIESYEHLIFNSLLGFKLFYPYSNPVDIGKEFSVSKFIAESTM